MNNIHKPHKTSILDWTLNSYMYFLDTRNHWKRFKLFGLWTPLMIKQDIIE